MKSLAQLFSGYGDLAAQAIEQALLLGVSLGQDIAAIAQSVEQALVQPLYRALTVAADWVMSAFRGGVSDATQGSGLSGWIWRADLSGNPCGMCVAMEGTVHDISEDMASHIRCQCQQEFYSGEPPDVQPGQDWFAEQDDATQLDLLGPAKFAAFQDGAITLSDLIGIDHNDEYGLSRYERSLKQILGEKEAQQYYG